MFEYTEDAQSLIFASLSDHPRWSLVQDGNAMSKYLMMRRNRGKGKKFETSRISSGKHVLSEGSA